MPVRPVNPHAFSRRFSLTPQMAGYSRRYLWALFIVIGLTASYRTGESAIPEGAMHLLWLLAVAGYAPVLLEAILTGEIVGPPSIIQRQQNPIGFWLVSLLHLTLWLGSMALLLSLLLGLPRWW